MNVKPIRFDGPMVRALLDDRKTQHREVLKPQPAADARYAENVICKGRPSIVSKIETGSRFQVSPYAVGDLLWVRETWHVGTRPCPWNGWRDGIEYRADEAYLDENDPLPLWEVVVPEGVELESYQSCGWTPSIHMPRWASRLTLEVTEVRVQRLQEISSVDTSREGVSTPDAKCLSDGEFYQDRMRSDFRNLWNILNEKRGFGWQDNPWVTALTFRVIKENIDTVLAARAEKQKDNAK